ncbi:FAD:protein FMN transferase [Xylophilus sp. GOD-11R]|uniref:FAD:protein FMN transferase n=1 Tax=Xylophilus sp. GOD-11R TaxID=3089814 RepID=UPI00298C3EB9|nr:FAD:protein FMN transferase [Xylophilus sp. GOD-11R]WPB56102.1 FAD:protein FMN transferase [Xylophilus sp. GOD-11R]
MVRWRLPEAPARLLGGATMGTRWSLKFRAVTGLGDDVVRSAVETVLHQVVAQMSTWEAASDISVFNRAEAGSRHTLASEFATVVDAALACARQSGGAFDPTVAPLVDAWGFGPRDGPRDYADARPPSPARVTRAGNAVGWRRLAFDAASRTLTQPGGLCLDLSGIAKGFAVDWACEAVAACGVQDFLMEIGGELRARGHRPGGGPWAVGIEQPGGGALLPLPLRDCAVATSGDRWHAYRHDGVRYSHTLDPRTGAPVAHALASVTVVHPHCMQADAWATALLVLGPREGPAMADRYGLAAWFVQRGAQGDSGHASAAFERLL